MGDAANGKKLKDKLILLGLAVLIVAPFAIYWGISRQAPDVAGSGSDLSLLDSGDKLIVSQGLSDDDLDELARFENLEELQLHYSKITDAGMPKIAGCKTLKRLILMSVHVTDNGVDELALRATAIERDAPYYLGWRDGGYAPLPGWDAHE